MKTQRISNGIFIIIALICAMGMIYFGMRKEGYHVDEMYTYGLANSEYLPFMHFGESGYDVKDWMKEYGAGESFADLFGNLWKDFQILKEYDFQFYNTPIYEAYRIAQANSADTLTTTWVDGQDYQDYLAVSADNTFNYASVYYNQRGDVHPPLHYMILHTVCSVFQGSFSKWYALAINMAALLGTLWILYRMVNKFLGMGRMEALLTAAVYGFSCGFFTTALYIRMYALLTLLVLCFSYMHLKILSADYHMHKKDVLLLGATTLAGYLTHYYFVIFAIGMALVFAVQMCVQKKWSALLRYILTMGGTAAIGLCVWPFAIRHVFSGYRGQASLNVFLNAEFHWIKTKLILQQIFAQLFGGQWWIPTACLVLLVIALIVDRKQSGFLRKSLLLAVPTLIYVILTAQIVPFYVERYVMCTYPFWCILAVGMAGFWLKKIRKPMVYPCVMSVWVIVLLLLNNAWTHTPNYLGLGGQETATIPPQSHMVYVLEDGTWNESAEDTLLLSKCEQVAVVYRSNLPVLTDTYQYEDGDCVIVAVSRKLDIAQVVEETKKILNTPDMQEAFREENSNTVRVYLK